MIAVEAMLGNLESDEPEPLETTEESAGSQVVARDGELATPGQALIIKLPDRTTSFAYNVLDPKIAKEAQDAANLIRGSLESAKRSMFDIGTALLKIKSKLRHGQFGDWILAEFDMTGRTAQNYMRVVDAFGAKCETVSVLQQTSIYRLASKSTPAAIRDDVVAEIEKGNVPTQNDIEARIASNRMATGKGARRLRATAKPLTVRAAPAGIKGLSQVQAAEEAMSLIRRCVGAELPRLIELMQRAGGLSGDELAKLSGPQSGRESAPGAKLVSRPVSASSASQAKKASFGSW